MFPAGPLLSCLFPLQFPPIGSSGLFFGASYRDKPAEGDRDAETADQRRHKAFDRWTKDANNGQVAVDGWRYWRQIENVYFLQTQCRARNDWEWYKLCCRRRTSYESIPVACREEQITIDSALLNGIALGAPDAYVNLKLPSELMEWGVEFEEGSLRIRVDRDSESSDYGKVFVDDKSVGYRQGVGTGWRPWEVMAINGTIVSDVEGLKMQLDQSSDVVDVRFRLVARTGGGDPMDASIGIFYYNQTVTNVCDVPTHTYTHPCTYISSP